VYPNGVTLFCFILLYNQISNIRSFSVITISSMNFQLLLRYRLWQLLCNSDRTNLLPSSKTRTKTYMSSSDTNRERYIRRYKWSKRLSHIRMLQYNACIDRTRRHLRQLWGKQRKKWKRRCINDEIRIVKRRSSIRWLVRQIMIARMWQLEQ